MPRAKSYRKQKAAAAAMRAENERIALIDQLREFEEFKAQFLPLLRKDLKDGLSPEQIRDKYASLAQATVVASLANPDAKVRHAAAKDLLDRSEGMAKQRVENTHKLEKLPEEQLDAMLLSQLKDVENVEAEDSEEQD